MAIILFPSPCCNAPSVLKKVTEHVVFRTCTNCGREFQA